MNKRRRKLKKQSQSGEESKKEREEANKEIYPGAIPSTESPMAGLLRTPLVAGILGEPLRPLPPDCR